MPDTGVSFDWAQFLSNYGPTTSILFYLLISYQKRMDKLVISVNRLIGVVMTLAKDQTTFRGDLDGD